MTCHVWNVLISKGSNYVVYIPCTIPLPCTCPALFGTIIFSVPLTRNIPEYLMSDASNVVYVVVKVEIFTTHMQTWSVHSSIIYKPEGFESFFPPSVSTP